MLYLACKEESYSQIDDTRFKTQLIVTAERNKDEFFYFFHNRIERVTQKLLSLEITDLYCVHPQHSYHRETIQILSIRNHVFIIKLISTAQYKKSLNL